MAVSNTFWYTLTSCCNPNITFNLNYDNVNGGSISNGVHTYTGNLLTSAPDAVGNTVDLLVPGECYEVVLNEGEAPLDGITSLFNPLFTYAGVDTCSEITPENDCDCADQQIDCDCPKGWIQIDGECVQETTEPATYTGGLLEVVAGDTSAAFGKFGVRLYPDISAMTYPLLGDGTYDINQNGGTGALVTPINTVQNQVFGSEVAGCVTGSTGGRLNNVGVWAPGIGIDTEVSFEFCVDIDGTDPKQYLIGIAGDNKVKFYIDGVLTVFLDTGNPLVSTTPFNYWHVFPITLTPGQHIIKLAGENLGGAASFGAEIYDITVADFQANLLDPAINSGDCGSTLADLQPYIIFSTENYVGEFIPDPTIPGEWQCPNGSTLDSCSGIPQCVTTLTQPLPACDVYKLRNCVDPNLEIIVDIQNPLFTEILPGSVISLDILNNIINTEQTNLCHTFFEIIHPDINGGVPISFNPTSYIQSGLYNGEPYYKMELDESIHGVSGLVLTYYTIFNSTSNQWEIWDTFTLIDGPSNTQCFIQQPYAFLGGGGAPLDCTIDPTTTTTVGCNYSTNDFSECGSFIVTNRIVEFCTSQVEIEITNCWEVIEQTTSVETAIPYSITEAFDSCLDCSLVFPCFRLVDCEGIEADIYTGTNLNAHLGSVVTLQDAQGEPICGCWSVEVSQVNCIDVPDVIVDKCFDDCTSCIPPPKPIPVPTNRKVEPGYKTGNCDPHLVEKAFCDYASIRYKNMVNSTYMIENCCPKDEGKAWVKYSKITLALLKDESPNVDSCNPKCNSHGATIQPNHTAITTYTDCYGIEQIITTELSDNVQIIGFCALNTTAPTIIISDDQEEIVGSYFVPITGDCEVLEEVYYEYQFTREVVPFGTEGLTITYVDTEGVLQTVLIPTCNDVEACPSDIITFCARFGSIKLSDVNNNDVVFANNESCPILGQCNKDLRLIRLGNCP